MENEKVTVVARMRAKPGMEDLVKLILQQLVAETRTEEGCINYDLHQSTTDPGVFLFYENWENRDHLERHSESAHIQAFRRKAGDLLAEPSEITLWEKIE
ncbi:MAG: antibiotic biosynthesis monooxygenase [Acidobacteria bacterium]|nr:antibiotic biosynthesis monooxygenase [Acidobacteriota bacterium]